MAVYLTQAQRIEARRVRLMKCIGDHLAGSMNREKLNKGQTARRLGVSPESLNRLLAGESVKLDTKTFVFLLDFAGIELKARTDELGEKK